MISIVGIMFKLLFLLFILKYFKLHVFTITSNLILSNDMVTVSNMTFCKCPCFISHHMRGNCQSICRNDIINIQKSLCLERIEQMNKSLETLDVTKAGNILAAMAESSFVHLPSFYDTHLSRHEANHGALTNVVGESPFVCPHRLVLSQPSPAGRSPFF